MNYNFLISKARPFINTIIGRHKHFSFLMDGKKIVSMGTCQPYKTNTMAKKYNYRYECMHSELSCIKRFPFPAAQLQYYTMVNIRFRALDGLVANSKPCPKCQRLLSDFQIRNVYYTNNQGSFVRF